MPSETQISTYPKIHKHVDACSFPFRNDTGRCLENGETISKGGLTGITNVPIGIDECGQAQLLCGPVVGYRMYMDSPLMADIYVGDSVYHPTSGQYLGVAIHGGSNGASRGLEDPAASSGTNCVWFLGLKQSGSGDGDGGGEPVPVTETTTISYSGAENIPPSFPVVDPVSGATVSTVEILLDPADGATMSVDEILAGIDKSNLPNGYMVKFQNIGEGTITAGAQVTGDQIVFETNGYVCFICANGEWIWA